MEVKYSINPLYIEIFLVNNSLNILRGIKVKIGGNAFTYFNSFLLKHEVRPSHYIGEFPNEIERLREVLIFRYIGCRSNYHEYLKLIELLKKNEVEVTYSMFILGE